jgi:3-oxoacyl-[acyl-carrier-protein] synthase-3
MGEFVLGTDGAGYKDLIVPTGGMRDRTGSSIETKDESGNIRSDSHLFMNGPGVFDFTISTIPKLVKETLLKNKLTIEQIDLFILHQASRYILEFLKKKMKIPDEKFFVDMEDCGNTVSASIPIALRRATDQGLLKPGDKVMLVGFGVGLSWGATILTW